MSCRRIIICCVSGTFEGDFVLIVRQVLLKSPPILRGGWKRTREPIGFALSSFNNVHRYVHKSILAVRIL